MTEPLNSGYLSEGLEAVFYFVNSDCLLLKIGRLHFLMQLLKPFINKESELNSEN